MIEGFVNGLYGARGYRIRPQQTMLLVDSTQGRIYLKSTDTLGIETMKTYSIAEVENKEETASGLLSPSLLS